MDVSMTKFELEGGKYTIVHENGASLRVYRHGELWQNLTGDNLVLAMCNEIEELKRKLALSNGRNTCHITK